MSLMRFNNFIDGKWSEAACGKTFEVVNPANNKIIGIAADSTCDDANKAIEAATSRFPSWAATPAKERGQLLRNLFQLMNEHSEELAKIITAESGKPITEAKTEVLYSGGIDNFYFYIDLDVMFL